MIKKFLPVLLVVLTCLSAFALNQKTLEGNRYIAQKEKEIREARSSGNTGRVAELMQKRDSAIVNHHINRYLYGPCPSDMSEVEDSKVYIGRIESEPYKSFARDYEPLLTLYRGFTNNLYGIIANQTFDDALNNSRLLRATEAQRLRTALELSNYWSYYETNKTDKPISIPYLDDLVDRMQSLIDDMELYLDSSTVEKYRAERNAIMEALTAGGSAVDPNTVYVGSVKIELVKVEGGTVNIKNSTIKVETFSIGKTEVTQELWQAVMGSNPSNNKGSNLPVEEVSWNDCQEFIRKLNAMTGYNFRLPTEAEWEFAARGGQKTHNYKYSGSNDIGSVAWYDGNSGNKTHPVATKAPNELGIYDMSGNVWEWCQDLYNGGPNRVRRGGSWLFNASYCGVSFRDNYSPDNRYGSLGLRLAL